jgi:hypothetical protein
MELMLTSLARKNLPINLYGHKIWCMILSEENRLIIFLNRVLR